MRAFAFVLDGVPRNHQVTDDEVSSDWILEKLMPELKEQQKIRNDQARVENLVPLMHTWTG